MQIIAIIGIISLFSIHPPLYTNTRPSYNYKTMHIRFPAYVEMDADHLDADNANSFWGLTHGYLPTPIVLNYSA